MESDGRAWRAYDALCNGLGETGGVKLLTETRRTVASRIVHCLLGETFMQNRHPKEDGNAGDRTRDCSWPRRLRVTTERTGFERRPGLEENETDRKKRRAEPTHAHYTFLRDRIGAGGSSSSERAEVDRSGRPITGLLCVILFASAMMRSAAPDLPTVCWFSVIIVVSVIVFARVLNGVSRHGRSVARQTVTRDHAKAAPPADCQHFRVSSSRRAASETVAHGELPLMAL
uniref:Uncharacterized protein n=1 Tax=Anopheles farauti TaxID=69004 RepID=A0A182Q3V2_9DIPT